MSTIGTYGPATLTSIPSYTPPLPPTNKATDAAKSDPAKPNDAANPGTPGRLNITA